MSNMAFIFLLIPIKINAKIIFENFFVGDANFIRVENCFDSNVTKISYKFFYLHIGLVNNIRILPVILRLYSLKIQTEIILLINDVLHFD